MGSNALRSVALIAIGAVVYFYFAKSRGLISGTPWQPQPA